MIFLVSRTYSEWTAESLDLGVPSSIGFVFEERSLSLREVIEMIRKGALSNDGGVLCTGLYMHSYERGVQREESLHIKLKVA